MKNATKRILSVVLAWMLMASAIPTAFAANETFSVQGMNSQQTITGNTAVKTDGSHWTWGIHGKITVPVRSSVSNLLLEGSEYRLLQNGELWQHSTYEYTTGSYTEITPVKVMDGIVEFAGEMYTKETYGYYLALKSDGTLLGWGDPQNLTGVYGDYIQRENATVLLTGVSHVEQSNCGWMALKSDGTLWSAGYDYHDALNPGAGVDWGDKPLGKIMDNVAAFSVNFRNVLVIKTDGSLWSWGDNNKGQIGNGAVIDTFAEYGINTGWQSSPVKILDDVIYAKAGWTPFAVTSNGALYGWGNNEYQQLGFVGGNLSVNGITPAQSTPKKLMDNVAMAIEGSASFSVIVKRDGTLWTAGRNSFGQTGHPQSKYPEIVPTFTKLMDNVAFPEGMVTTGNQPSTPATNEIQVLLNGNPVTFDQAPIIEGGRTLVPMRAIFEAMGATVTWEQATQTVTGTKGDIIVKMTIGNPVMTVNGKAITLDVAPKVLGGRTLVPVRAVAESFDADVQWDSTAQTVIITTTNAGDSTGTPIVTPVEPEVPSVSLEDYCQQVFELTNAERAKVGAVALKYNDDLAVIAQARAEAFAEMGYLPSDHDIPGMGDHNASLRAFGFKGASYSGENCTIAATPDGAITNWLNSTAGHKQNMLGQLKVGSVACKWTGIGVGCAEGSNGVYYWVQIFVQ